MQSLELNVDLREGNGKSAARELRRTGWVPAVLYGDEAAQSLRVKAIDFERMLHGVGGEHVLINLVIGEKGERQRALIREVQHHPTRGFIQHIDFQRISATKKIRIPVPIVLRGEPIGVKEDSGVLEHVLREVTVECLPADLPDHLEVDIAHMRVGEAMHVSDLPFERIQIHADPAAVVVLVSRPVVVKEPTAEAAEAAAAAAAEGAAPAEGAAAAEGAKPEKGEKGEKGKAAAPAAPAAQPKKEKGK